MDHNYQKPTRCDVADYWRELTARWDAVSQRWDRCGKDWERTSIICSVLSIFNFVTLGVMVFLYCKVIYGV